MISKIIPGQQYKKQKQHSIIGTRTRRMYKMRKTYTYHEAKHSLATS